MLFARWRRLLFLLVVAAAAPIGAAAEEVSPFDPLAGRWVGEGRFGSRDGKTESVKCRVTYILPVHAHEMRQTIRCASQSGNIEVQSTVAHTAGQLSGVWKELTREWSGELSGSTTQHGFKVAIKGSDLAANMDIVVKGNRQIIEIQFIDSAIIGLTLVLTKG